MQGRVIAGRYRLETPIGEGAMGCVWRAVHETLGTPVAVKVMTPEGAALPDSLPRFEREAKIAARIRSVHAVSVIDHGYDGGQPFIVMEWLDGESLRERLDRNGRLSIEETSRVITHVTRALSIAHEQGLVHRDIKPENIFIARGEEATGEIAKVLDFGLSKVARPGHISEFQTKGGVVMGTPLYVSPEQVQGERPVDFRTDLWSFAVVCFECLTGRLPFNGSSVAEILAQVLQAPAPIPSQICPDAALNAAIDAWMARALARDPEARFGSARELADAFHSAVRLPAPSGLGIEANPHADTVDKGPDTLRAAWPQAGSSAPPPQASNAAGHTPVVDEHSFAETVLQDPPDPGFAEQAAKTVALDESWNAPALPPQEALAGSSGATPYVGPSASSPPDGAPLDPNVRAGPSQAQEVGRERIVSNAPLVESAPPPPVAAPSRRWPYLLGLVAVTVVAITAVLAWRFLGMVEPSAGAPTQDAPRAEHASLRVDSKEPGVKLFVDGIERGTLPLELRDLPAGQLVLRFVGDADHAPLERAVTLRSGETLDLGTIELVPREVDVRFELRTEGAEVTLARGDQNTRPQPLLFDAEGVALRALDATQTWRVRARKAGYEDWSEALNLTDGSRTKTVRIELRAAGAEPDRSAHATPADSSAVDPDEPATIKVNSVPISKALVDGRPVGSTPTQVEVPAGTHSVVFIHRDLGRRTVQVTVAPGETQVAAVNFNRDP